MSIVVLTKDQVESYVKDELAEHTVDMRAEWEADDLVLAKKVDEQMSAVKERIEAVAQDTKALEAFVAGKLNMINPYGMEKVGTDLDRKIRELSEKVSDVQTATGAYGSNPRHGARIQSLEHSEKDIRQQLVEAQQGAVAQAGELSGLAAKVQDLEKLSIRSLYARVASLEQNQTSVKPLPVVPATAEDRVRALEAKLQMTQSGQMDLQVQVWKHVADLEKKMEARIAALEKHIQDPYGLADYFANKEEVGSDTPNAEVRKRVRIGWK